MIGNHRTHKYNLDSLSWFFRKKDSLIKITTYQGYKKNKVISKLITCLILILLVYSYIYIIEKKSITNKYVNKIPI